MIDVKWTFDANGREFGGCLNRPVIDGNTLYIGSDDSHFYAIDKRFGTVDWSFRTGAHRVRCCAVIGPDLIYISSRGTSPEIEDIDVKVFALEKTGERVWDFKIEGGLINLPSYEGATERMKKGYSSAEYSTETNMLYFGATDNIVYSLDGTTGEEIWNFKTDGEIWTTPVYKDGVLYTGSNDNKLYALDGNTGEKIWEFETEGWVESGPVIKNNIVYIGSEDKKIYAISSSEKVWDFETGDMVHSTPIISDNILYVGSDDGKVYALNAEDGSKIWDFQTGSLVWGTPAVHNGIVYIGSEDCNVYALDSQTGDKIWEFKTDGWVTTTATVDPEDGTVYIGSEGGRLYALQHK